MKGTVLLTGNAIVHHTAMLYLQSVKEEEESRKDEFYFFLLLLLLWRKRERKLHDRIVAFTQIISCSFIVRQV